MPDEWSWDSWYHDYDLSRAAIQRAEKLQVDATLAWHAYWNEILDDPDLAREAGFNLRHRILILVRATLGQCGILANTSDTSSLD